MDEIDAQIKKVLPLLWIEEPKLHLQSRQPEQRSVQVAFLHLASFECRGQMLQVCMITPVSAIHVGAGDQAVGGASHWIGKFVRSIDVAHSIAVTGDVYIDDDIKNLRLCRKHDGLFVFGKGGQ